MIKARIKILDGFRCMAILPVLFYHFFSRWTPPLNPVSLYPYEGKYNYFVYGKLGVQFFFIISGFVIFFTLDNTATFTAFWKKRFIRLFPSLLIASLITFLVLKIFNHESLFQGAANIANFLPSLTFIPPDMLNSISPKFNFAYINGSYWSLWPEIQFYLLASCLYFYKRAHFIKNFITLSAFLIICNHILVNVFNSNKLGITFLSGFAGAYAKWIQSGFNLVIYLPFFCLGILFYVIFKNHQHAKRNEAFIKIAVSFFIAYIIYSATGLPVKLLYVLMSIAFFVFIYFPSRLAFFETKFFTAIGESSYFLYLIHETIGLFIIYTVAQYFLPFGFLFSIVLMIIFIVLSRAFTIYIDRKISRWLKIKIFAPAQVKVGETVS